MVTGNFRHAFDLPKAFVLASSLLRRSQGLLISDDGGGSAGVGKRHARLLDRVRVSGCGWEFSKGRRHAAVECDVAR